MKFAKNIWWNFNKNRKFGKGIDENELTNIFEPFYRNKKHVGSIKGSGLGLTIVKKLADALNIQINVKSEIDKGSTFSLFIPKTMNN